MILKAADQAMNAEEVREKLIARFLHDGTIIAMFEREINILELLAYL